MGLRRYTSGAPFLAALSTVDRQRRAPRPATSSCSPARLAWGPGPADQRTDARRVGPKIVWSRTRMASPTETPGPGQVTWQPPPETLTVVARKLPLALVRETRQATA